MLARNTKSENGGAQVREPQTFEATWRRRFERFAAQSEDDAGIAGWTNSGLEARTRRFLQLWQGRIPGERWLDAGCGAGTYCRHLCEHGIAVTGTDYSFLTLTKARQRLGDQVPLVLADVRKLPFREAMFDGVLCFGVLQALSESSSTLRELARQLRPGGTLWVDGLNQYCLAHAADVLHRRVRARRLHLRYESPRRIKRLLLANKLGDVEIHWLPILPARLNRFQRWLESDPARWMLRWVPFLGLLVSHSFLASARRPAAARTGKG